MTTQSGADDAWHNAPVTVTFTASDDRSGVKSTEYRLDGGAWQTGTSVTVSGDGVHALDYRSTDNAGNVEATKSVQVKIDTVAPVTTQSGADDAWHNAPVTVTFSASDDRSGVKSTEYRLDGGAWQTGTSVTVSGDGVHALDYRSTDNAGNVEATKSVQVKIGVPPGPTEHAWDLVAVGKYAYLADGAAGLKVYDISKPASPTLVATCDTPGTAKDVSVVGRYAYVADGASGLQVVDVADPTRPRIVGALPTPSAAEHVAMSLGRIYEDFETTSGWVADAGTLSLDTSNVKHGSRALRLTAAAGGAAQAHKDNLGWDLSRDKDNLQLWIYVDSAGAKRGQLLAIRDDLAVERRTTTATTSRSSPTSTKAGTNFVSTPRTGRRSGHRAGRSPSSASTIDVPAPSDSVANDLRSTSCAVE